MNQNPYMPYQMNYQYQNPMRNSNTAINNGINWVQGIEGAKAYQLYPNTNIILMDSENDGVFYIKTSDNVGMCNLRTFKYAEVNSVQPNYITREEVMQLINELKENKNEQPIQSIKSKSNKTNNE